MTAHSLIDKHCKNELSREKKGQLIMQRIKVVVDTARGRFMILEY
jgi:hypothetical protein